MLKFNEIFRKGIPKYTNQNNIPDQYSIMREWKSFYEETKKFLEKTKNRTPIVDFKVRQETIDKFNKE